MSIVTVNDASLSAIADAIREKLDVETTYLPSQMAAAIESISGTDLTSADAGKVVVESGGEYVLQAQTSRSISQNGTYDTTTNDEVEVNVSGGGSATLVSKTITQNGTYNASGDNADGYSSVTVNVSGGGSSGYVEKWDLTKSTTGEIEEIDLVSSNVTFDSSGAVFDSTNDCMTIPIAWDGMTIEIDVDEMQLTSGTHRRFIMTEYNFGLIYRSTGVWALYVSTTWYESNETDGSFFDGSTVKVNIDKDGYWHIYKDNVLWWEPSKNLRITSRRLLIGSTDGSSINNAAISGIRILGKQ